MSLDRPEKRAVRTLWLESVIQFSEAFPEDVVPLYLTLSGAEGRDIELLVENNLLPLTETGAVALEHRHRVIAVENSSRGVAALLRKYPGLKILEHPFQSLVRSHSPFRWPAGVDEQFCSARVVNLDLNETLAAVDDTDQVTFPVLQWIAKLGQIHAARQLDWCLCFTLHGEIGWSDDVSLGVREYLSENFESEPIFGEDCRRLFGDVLYAEIVSERPVKFACLSIEEQQLILMAFVPKKIAHLTCPQGWRVETQRNLRYGGVGDRAPMVTWIVNFVWDPRASRRPQAVYRESLRVALSGAGRIEEDGTIS